MGQPNPPRGGLWIMASLWVTLAALTRCAGGEVNGNATDAGDPWRDLTWADPPGGADAHVPPSDDGATAPDGTTPPALDGAIPADAPSVSDIPPAPLDSGVGAGGLGDPCSASAPCGASLRCACRAGTDCFCTRLCGEGLEPCPAPTTCGSTPLGRVCLPPSPTPGGRCAEDRTCPTGLRCACRAGADCYCTRLCGEGLEPCPAPTTCASTPLGPLCLPPAPPAPMDTGVTLPPVDTGVTLPPVDTGVPPTIEPVPACLATAASGDGGGLCSGLDHAYTARGINVGYYPFRVVRPIFQFSGDYDGLPTTRFRPGTTWRGVMLQELPVGSYVGLSSVGPNYNPPTGCEVDSCGNPSRAACGNNSPPLRAPVNGFYWGYAYQGASHMQGWILALPGSLAYVGDDPSHPCALGPAGADFEVHSACGRTTRCQSANPTCGSVNRCDEGNDDCGRASCGAMAGGTLSPRAWRRTVTLPARTHACVRSPPHPDVRCLANGTDEDFFFVYPFGAYLYWAQNSTTKAWLHFGDRVQVYFHNRDRQGVLWDFVEVLSSGTPVLTPASDGAGAPSGCDADHPSACHPCLHGGTCGWVQDVFLQ